MIDTKEMEEALEESHKTGNSLLDEYVLFDDDILSRLASDELAATELIETLEEEADTVMPAQVWKINESADDPPPEVFTPIITIAGDEETNEDEKEARYEEGVSVDPTEEMSEEDKKKWEEMIEKNKDKFKDKKAENKTAADDWYELVVRMKDRPRTREVEKALPASIDLDVEDVSLSGKTVTLLVSGSASEVARALKTLTGNPEVASAKSRKSKAASFNDEALAHYGIEKNKDKFKDKKTARQEKPQPAPKLPAGLKKSTQREWADLQRVVKGKADYNKFLNAYMKFEIKSRDDWGMDRKAMEAVSEVSQWMEAEYERKSGKDWRTGRPKKAAPSITAHDLAKIDSGRSKAASDGAYADRLFTVANLLSLSKNEKRARIALGEVSDVLDLYGVETVEKDGQRALYINTGDNNRPTIVYNVDNGRMVIATTKALFKSGFEQEESNIKLATRYSLPSKRGGYTVDFGIDRSFGRFFQLVGTDGEAVVDKDCLNQGAIAGLLKKYGKVSSDLDKAINAFMLDLDPMDMGLKYAKKADPKKVRLAELRELRKLRKEAKEVARFAGAPLSVDDWIAWED